LGSFSFSGFSTKTAMPVSSFRFLLSGLKPA